MCPCDSFSQQGNLAQNSFVSRCLFCLTGQNWVICLSSSYHHGKWNFSNWLNERGWEWGQPSQSSWPQKVKWVAGPSSVYICHICTIFWGDFLHVESCLPKMAGSRSSLPSQQVFGCRLVNWTPPVRQARTGPEFRTEKREEFGARWTPPSRACSGALQKAVGLSEGAEW